MRINTPFYLLTALLFQLPLWPEEQQPPSYSAATIVNMASNEAGALAPYTYATIYGENLANNTVAAMGIELSRGQFPMSLGGTRVLINSSWTVICLVSPNQINLLIPSSFRDGEVTLQVSSGALAGPEVKLMLHPAAPALFLSGIDTALTTHADFSVITDQSPAEPGEVVILWATGLGPTVPDFVYGFVPDEAAPLRRLSEFKVFLDGHELPAENVMYAGIAPGFPGLYQINLRMPWLAFPDPEVRIALGDQVSPPGIRIPFRRDTRVYPARERARGLLR